MDLTSARGRRPDAQAMIRSDVTYFRIPHLYGLSLVRTSLRVYPGDKVIGGVTPRFLGCSLAGRILPPDFSGGVGFRHLVLGCIEKDVRNC